ncbi:hypothetical protein WJX84_008837 [Apatococcus fuscideae]|uniref:SAM-dependent MTase RsmB/NOP-type domain-containing protein n=1 Tax=Apatococcus fuscideae TaxID=2026836 RepID=A0AAW1T208_9CHLO
MSGTDKALYALVNQVLETLAGLGIVYLATRKFMPLSPDLLRYDFREPFAKPRGWLAWGLLGVLLSPLVVGAAAFAFSLFGFDEVNGKGTVDGVAQILSLDFPSFASLFGVTAVLAPILEETVFRGFLLTSLTKFMPTWAAVIASSVAFGLAHLSTRDLPQLVVLGTLLGFIYVRSRNLLSPMLIHGVWNGTVLTILFLLVQSGVDLKELFSAGCGTSTRSAADLFPVVTPTDRLCNMRSRRPKPISDRQSGQAKRRRSDDAEARPTKRQKKPRPALRGVKGKPLWACSSVVDRQAAFALEKILEAHRTKRRGVSLKSLTLGSNIEAKKATFAVTTESIKYLQIIDAILDRSQILKECSQLARPSAVILVYELLFGEGVRAQGPAERHVLSCKDSLEAALSKELEAHGAEDVSELLPATEESRPRSVRVNTIKVTKEAAISRLQADFGSLEPDGLLDDVLILPSSCALHDHPWVKNGSLILQSKASCMPAQALSPEPGWTVLDCCAAPGNKTTHLAARLGNIGKVIAVDRDPVRFKRLKDNAKLAGATCIQCIQDDFLKLPLDTAQFSSVDAVLLDPSCSGSGTAHNQVDRLLSPTDEVDCGRLESLAAFQEKALRHAFKLPKLKRLVYSTCSSHSIEGEEVIEKVMPLANQLGFHLEGPFPSWHRRGHKQFPDGKLMVRADAKLDRTDGFFLALFSKTDLENGIG